MFWNVLYGQACFTPSHMSTLHFYHVLYVLNLFMWEAIFIALTTSQLVHSTHIIQSSALKFDFGSIGERFPLTAKAPCCLFNKLVLWGFFLNYFSYYLVIDPQLCRYIGECGNLQQTLSKACRLQLSFQSLHGCTCQGNEIK